MLHIVVPTFSLSPVSCTQEATSCGILPAAQVIFNYLNMDSNFKVNAVLWLW
jgi:hypothetical protein